MNQDTDEALMLRYCTQGDMQSFAVLYERHKGPVFRYILRQVGQHATAEELLQDVWAGIIKSGASYKTSAKFRTYLYSIAHNRIIDHFRRSRLRVASVEGVFVEVSDDVDSPDEHLNKMQQINSVRDALKQLPPEQRDVFVLKEESGLSLQEVADVTGVNFEAAKSRYRYAVKKLAEILQGGADG